MPQPARSIPARITASAASRPRPPPAGLSRRPSPVRSPPRAPFFALRRGGRIRASGRPGLADLLVHLRDLLTDRRELRMPGYLPPHLLHLTGRQLPPNGAAPPGSPRPQEPRPVPGMIQLRARAVQLPALPVVLAHRPAPEITHRSEPCIQPVPLSLQLRKRRLGHGPPTWLLINNQAPSITSPDVGPLHMCRAPHSARWFFPDSLGSLQ